MLKIPSILRANICQEVLFNDERARHVLWRREVVRILLLVLAFLVDFFVEVELPLAVVSFNPMVGKEMPRIEKEFCFFVCLGLFLILDNKRLGVLMAVLKPTTGRHRAFC